MNDKSTQKIKASLKECLSDSDVKSDFGFLLEGMSEDELVTHFTDMIRYYVEGEKTFG